MPTRRLYYLLLFIVTILLWRWTDGWHRFLCSGPVSPPLASRRNQEALLSQPSGLHNPHTPLVVESPTIEYLDLDNASFTRGEDRVLILTPLRDAAPHLGTHFRLLSELTYPHQSTDLAFLVGDSKDDTLRVLRDEIKRLQAPSNPSRFRSTMIVEKDLGDDLSQAVEERHSLTAQASRRKGIGRARNYLLYAALNSEHKWVYWRDVDIVENPATVIEDLIKHGRDIIVPRYKEYRTHRSYLNWMAYENRKKRQKYLHKEVPLDGIGGVNIMVRAEVHRSGINFPCYAFENQADTEGFAAMAKRAGYEVWGLPNYVVWHVDTEEKEGNLKGKKEENVKGKKQYNLKGRKGG
ncbi:MAG: hypothetical protein Q9181_005762 [Wetmoreana brouardii]